MSSPTETAIVQGASVASDLLPLVETAASVLLPGSSQTVALILKIAQGVLGKVPEAIALYDQIQSGIVPTQAQLDAYAAGENSSYAKLMADIAAGEKTAK